jgi:4-amino-4-deoxy-L-arabinose transferase-like glycosyltransferase
MMDSWHNFFYNSFDPGGFISVDKPPVALWVQVVSAKIFGFSKLSVLVPQALEGILAVLLLYHLVRRQFGPWAAFFAGLALALTPVSVAVDRGNNTDGCLVLVLLLAAWALLRATEKGSLWLLLVSMFLVGVGFNTKMLVAFVVLPTFYLVYLLGASVNWRSRLGDLTLATVAVFAVSLSWPVAYDLTPPEKRPFAGSSPENSMLELTVGHNGVQRFVRRGRFGGLPPGANSATTNNNAGANQDGPTNGQTSSSDGLTQVTGMQAVGGNGQGTGLAQQRWQNGLLGGGPGPQRGFNGRGFGGGPAGIWRLVTPHLVGQVMWLFPLAVVGLVTAVFQARWSWTISPAHQSLLLWLGWLATFGVVFSFAGGIFHPYYLVMMAPALAALTGIGLVALWNAYGRGGWRAALLPGALLLTACWQALAGVDYPDLSRWMTPALVIATLVGALGLLVLRAQWWSLALSLAVLVAVGWLWNRGEEAPDPLALAAAELDAARSRLAGVEGYDTVKKVIPDFQTLLPDLKRQARLVTAPLLIGTAVAAGSLIVVWLLARRWRRLSTWAPAALAVAWLGVLLSPSVWAITPLWGGTNIMLPAADASVFSRRDDRGNGFRGFGGRSPEEAQKEREKLIAFLKANYHGERWALAVMSSREAGPLIIEGGLPVVAVGGFMGGDPTLGTESEDVRERLAKMIANKEVRFFMISSFRLGGPQRMGVPGGGPPGATPGGPRQAVAGQGTLPRGAGQANGAAGFRGPGGFGRGGEVSRWLLDQVRQGKAKDVPRELWGLPLPERREQGDTSPDQRPGAVAAGDPNQQRPTPNLDGNGPNGQPRQGPFGFNRMRGMIGAANLYDCRPEEAIVPTRTDE